MVVDWLLSLTYLTGIRLFSFIWSKIAGVLNIIFPVKQNVESLNFFNFKKCVHDKKLKIQV